MTSFDFLNQKKLLSQSLSDTRNDVYLGDPMARRDRVDCLSWGKGSSREKPFRILLLDFSFDRERETSMRNPFKKHQMPTLGTLVAHKSLWKSIAHPYTTGRCEKDATDFKLTSTHFLGLNDATNSIFLDDSSNFAASFAL